MTRQQTRFVSSKNLRTLSPRFVIFSYVLARLRTLTNLTKSFHVFYLFYQSKYQLCFVIASSFRHCIPIVYHLCLYYNTTWQKNFLPQGVLSTALIPMDRSTYWPSSSSPNGGDDRGEQEQDVNLHWNVCWTRVTTKRLVAFLKTGQERNEHVKSGSLLQCLTIWVMSCHWIPSVPLGISRIAPIQSYHADISSTFFAVDSDYRTRSSWNLLNSARKATYLSSGQVRMMLAGV
jgi:hypothetical protein